MMSKPFRLRIFLLLLLQPFLGLKLMKIIFARRAAMLRGYALALLKLEEPAKLGSNFPSEIVDTLAKNIKIIEFSNIDAMSHIGVASDRLLYSILHIVKSAAFSQILIDGKIPLSLSNTNYAETIRQAKFVDISFPDQSGISSIVRLESYTWEDDFKWMSSNPINVQLRAIYNPDVFAGEGKTSPLSIIGFKTPEDVEIDVDAVYTWVNNKDPEWQKLYNLHCADDKKMSEAHSMQRFDNKQELKFSLRSVFRYAPWIRHIYVVSNCAPPVWLNIESEKITWIDHSEIIPDKYLPTFNSHVIESYLHHISTLSNNFLYFNDDFFITRPLPKRKFIDSSGRSISFYEGYGVVSGKAKEGDPDYLNASRNSALQVALESGFYPTLLHKHVPYSLRKDVLCELERKFKEPVREFRSNRFRGINDLNIPSFFYHGYSSTIGQSCSGDISSRLVKSNDVLGWREKLFSDQSCDIVCINDGDGDQPVGWETGIRSFLEASYPAPAPWETNS